jgi:Protein of unknown function (DUF2855)
MMTQGGSWELRVDKAELAKTDIGPGLSPNTVLAGGQALLAVESYAMTANNVTYAVMGELMAYWQFFPTDEGFGVVPVWGFGEVIASEHTGLTVGERFYGYFPSASHLLVEPTAVSESGFTDGAAHRSGLPGVYNNYTNVALDPSYKVEAEDIQSLLRPLFMTSFFIDDYLAADDFFGADKVLISSASSKTAFALAYCLHRRGREVVGLTSASNVQFVESLGWYSEVWAYDDIEGLADSTAVSFVDMAGSATVRASIHNGFQNLRHSLRVGATHWEDLNGPSELPGPVPEMFFAPTQISKRYKDWGPDAIQARVAESWTPFAEQVSEFLKIERRSGSAAAQDAFLAALDGSADPGIGVIVLP